MEKSLSRSVIITAGLSIFAMLFGAGNIVFALSIGQFAQDKTLFATLGLIVSGVAVPLLGLIAMTLFNGDCKSFFSRVGQVPGFLLTLLMLGLLGPFGAIPRCLVLSYSTSKAYLPSVSLPLFTFLCCVLIFFLTVKRTRIFDVIGYFLTPLKLSALVFLIIVGFFYATTLPVSSHNEAEVFLQGFKDGYQTMDLLGAFFFCSIVLEGLRKKMDDAKLNDHSLVRTTIIASCIGTFLLAVIYLGFSFIAAFHSQGLTGVLPHELVSKIATIVLGTYGGVFVSFTVTIACMTTATALSSVFAEFLHKEISNEKVSYPLCLLATLGITFVISTLDFMGIIKMLAPILHLFYPALIVLSIVNILYKKFNFQPVKVPVLLAIVVSALSYLLA